MDGTSIPEVDFDIGPSWSGLIPISATPWEPRKVFLSVQHFSCQLTPHLAILLVLPSWAGREPRRPHIMVCPSFALSTRTSQSNQHCRTNGGPGCSSLKGLLQENGVSSPPSRLSIQFSTSDAYLAQPFTWGFGQARPTRNEWSWTNVSSVLYVEQPAGTGFSQGEPIVAVRIHVAT